MAILNVTPDSFSDGGRYEGPAAAVAAAREMVREGAAIIDVGGESTRPGAPTVPISEELGRVLPVVGALRSADVLVSVDTRKAIVAREALAAGADLVNDVNGLRDPEMQEVCASAGVPAVMMHSPVEPGQMEWSGAARQYGDVVLEVRDELAGLALEALRCGVPSVVLDPGFGFGKSPEQNLDLLRRLPELKALGYPVLVGASRKSTLGRVAQAEDSMDRDAASIAAHLYAFSRGADALRVHDVRGHAQALRVWRALEDQRG
jgi:dihydropteroate synthase